jgi:Chemoreceptor zinc-binding domain
MTKEEVLKHLKTAKNVHTDWVHKAKSLMNGAGSREDLVPVTSHECDFGKWFYYDGQRLSALSNNPLTCMKNIDQLHEKFHTAYRNVFEVYFPEEKKTGLISKLFGEKHKTLSPEEMEFVDAEFRELASVSQEMLDELNRLERRLEAVSDEKIESLV